MPTASTRARRPATTSASWRRSGSPSPSPRRPDPPAPPHPAEEPASPAAAACPAQVAIFGSVTHQHFHPADANCCQSLLLDPDATISIDLHEWLFLLVTG